MGLYAKATALAEEFIRKPQKAKPLTSREQYHKAKWKAIREEWAKEDTEEVKPRFPRRA
jgi:hypothetical protein